MDIGLAVPPITLETRLVDHDRPVLLSGVQALVRVLLEQSRLDRAAGLNTGGLVSGYRGSPLGGVDQEMWRREKLLGEAGIRFQPGLNEDLAATMLWGSQQVDLFPGKRVDGVFGMWYGKGPGVDRSGDAFRCANTMGTSKHGGVLAVSGDDHVAHSSVFPHSTEGIFESVNIPILQPAGRAGHRRFRARRHRDVALRRALGRAEDHCRDRRATWHRGDPQPAPVHHARDRPAPARPQHGPASRLAGAARATRTPRVARTAAGGAGLGAREPGWTNWSAAKRAPRSASSPSARRITT